jgi:hypothetical protein
MNVYRRGLLLACGVTLVACSSSNGASGSVSPEDAGGGGQDARVEASVDAAHADGGAHDAATDHDAAPAGPPLPAWSAYASRGTDSRWGVPLAYSTKSSTFLGFGGSQYPAADTGGMFSLSMTTGTWTKLTDSNEPTPGYCSCTTYLPDQDQVLLLAGLGDSGPLPAGAWIYDVKSGAWSAIAGTVPGAGIGCAATYMPAMHEAIVFGGVGETTGYSAETWAYDPVAKSFAKLSPATSPPARADSIATYDPGDGGRMLVFAGTQDEQTSANHRNDLWAFDGTTWTELHPTGGPPPPRRVPAGGFDPTTRRWVVFGGTIETMDYGDLWLLDVNAMTWTQLSGNGAPPVRGFASSGFDPGTGAWFVVGGLQMQGGVTLTDGWKLQLH